VAETTKVIKKMWRLKIADGGKSPYIFSTNNFVGRQIWEFDSEARSDEERAQVEEARLHFHQNRFQRKACGDRLWRFQVLSFLTSTKPHCSDALTIIHMTSKMHK